MREMRPARSVKIRYDGAMVTMPAIAGMNDSSDARCLRSSGRPVAALLLIERMRRFSHPLRQEHSALTNPAFDVASAHPPGPRFSGRCRNR
jgi:hypothetical protein